MRVSKAIVGLLGLAGAGVTAAAPGEDPIKDGQTVNSRAAAAPGGDPIKDGQTLMAISGNDLGSSAPARPSYSLATGWHAYVYDRGGLRLVQINDGSGVVRVVIAYSSGATLSLPLGVDADQVMTGTAPGSTIVYRDANIEIESAGSQWYVHPRVR